MQKNILSEGTLAVIRHLAVQAGFEMDDFDAIDRAQELPDLLIVAKGLIGRVDGFGIGVGPLSPVNGKTFDQNTQAFIKLYNYVLNHPGQHHFRTKNVFMQIAFEEAIGRILGKRMQPHHAANEAFDLFEPGIFYYDILLDEKCLDVWALPGHEKSSGAQEEIRILKTRPSGSYKFHNMELMLNLMPELPNVLALKPLATG
jgi:hypothetical protein